MPNASRRVIPSRLMPLPALAFLSATALSTIGSAMGALESTYIATTSDPNTGALRTAVMIIVLLIASTLTVPLVPRLSSRWGSRRLYTATTTGTVVIWSMTGLAILSGLPAFPTLLVATPFIGITTGLSTVMAPLFARAYLSGDTMAGAYARTSVIMGLSWGVGALLGGHLFQESSPGVGIAIRGLLAIPLVITLALVTPAAGDPSSADRRHGSWRTLAHHITTPGPLRRVLALSCAVAVFALPYLSLIVPIADALRQVPLVAGAGLLMAGTSVGEMLSPVLVSYLQRRLPPLRAASIAAALCAASLLLFAAVSLVTSDRPELVLWLVIGMVFGAARYSAKAFELDAAVNSGAPDDEAVAAVSFVKVATAPIGLVLWSIMMTVVSVEAALIVGFVGLTASAAAVWRQSCKNLPAQSASD